MLFKRPEGDKMVWGFLCYIAPEGILPYVVASSVGSNPQMFFYAK